MARKIKLYMFNGSAPSMTARLMLEHKGIDYKPVHLLVGPHAFGLLGRGYVTMTVPALKIDGRRVQGSREISRALDELAPRAPLFGADPERRQAVEQAERWGEELQDTVRRLLLCASRRDRSAFSSVYRHANPLMRPAQRVSRGLVIKLASAGHRATDRAGEEDVAALPARLDQIDAWIEQGLLNGSECNAADFQIAPNLSLLMCFEDLASLVEGRPAARLAQRLAPEFPGEIRAVLPPAWLAPLGAAGREAPQSGPMGTDDVLRAIGYDEQRIATVLSQAGGPFGRHSHG
ncbi:MAG: glutathione S-transferase N-terminal domain-containing protein [Actinomycetota bacterium]|nr:glutathione S-transferase N-terminal domain-containing protein [Actinomycetota bacterium]